MSTIDLRDAFHTLRLAKTSQKYCGWYHIMDHLTLLMYGCYHNQEHLRCNGILIISKALSIVYSSPLLVLQLQHMGKHFPLSLLTPYLLSSQWQSPHQCRVCIGLYTLSSRWGLCIGYRIMKGVSERCIARLLLTWVWV